MRPRHRLATALLAGWVAAAAPAPEPTGLWGGEERGAVPATLAGGRVVDTAALAALLAQGDTGGGVVAVDVSVAQRRPEGLPPGAVWLPLAHRDIAGSVWLPEAGQSALAPATEAWVRQRLQALTGGDPARPVVFYCHPECWRSWNAAKRAVGWGYRAVMWYPQGVEGWEEAGHTLAAARAEAAP